VHDTSHPRRPSFCGRYARVVLVCGSLAAPLAAPAVADACSPAPCDVGSQVPTNLAVVPANLPGIFWRTDNDVDAGPESVRLVRVADAHEVPVEVVVLGAGRHEIAVLEPLAPDAEHTLILGSVCFGTGLADDGAPQFTLKTAGESPLPGADLGELIAGEPMRGDLELASINGGCSEPIDSAYVEVAMTLAAAVGPWKDVLVFETRVDGELWAPSGFLPLAPPEGESWLGRGVDRVYATCEAGEGVVDPSLSPGAHLVEMRARIPGTDIVLTSSEVEVLLSCAESGSTGGDAGSTAGTSTDTSTDTSAGASTGDGETTQTAAPTGGPTGPDGDASTTAADDTGGESDPDKGCSCRAPADDPATPTLAVVLLAGLARRRGRARPVSS